MDCCELLCPDYMVARARAKEEARVALVVNATTIAPSATMTVTLVNMLMLEAARVKRAWGKG
jgi:hypothetical protein